MHAAIFPRVIKQIIGEQNKETGELINRGSLDEYSCSDFSDMADAFSLYVKAYSGYIVRTGDMSSYQETTQQLLQMGQQLYMDIMTSFKREFNDIDQSDELDAEEKQAEMEDLFDSFDAAVDSLGAGYCNFVMQYREKLPGEILDALVKAADQFMERNVESDNAISQTMQGISLYSDFAEFLSKEMVSQVFPRIYPRVIQYLKEKPDEWQLAQVIYYALTCFLKKTQNVEAAGNQELMVMCVGLLDKAKEDGGEDALNFYDNGCGYLLWCGKLTKQ